MANPVYDAKHVAELLDIRYSADQFAAFAAPPSPLKGFLTFFDPGWSIVFLRRVFARGSILCLDESRIFLPQRWYANERFANAKQRSRYRQLRMEAISDSFSTTYADGKRLLLRNENIPLARVIVMAMTLRFLASGERLFPTYWVRSRDKDSRGRRVDTGYFFDRAGLSLCTSADSSPGTLLGIAPAWNVP